MKALAAGAAFLIFVIGANLMTSHFGLLNLAGMTFTAGTFAAGAVLIARDALSETSGRWAVLGCIVGGAALSGLSAPTLIATASAVAFLFAELADWSVYEPLRKRGWGRAVLLSSLAAGPIDTAIFLSIAPFPLTWEAVLTQAIIKSALAALTVLIVKGMQRALLRNRFISSNA